MQLARKLSLGLFLGILAVFAFSAHHRLNREAALLDASMKQNQRLIATTLASRASCGVFSTTRDAASRASRWSPLQTSSAQVLPSSSRWR